MTREALDKLWAVRLERINRMRDSVENFKECGQCRSVSPRYFGLCPWCKCYRFKLSVDEVRATLCVMMTRPWSLNSGVVPRIAGAEALLAQPPLRLPTEHS